MKRRSFLQFLGLAPAAAVAPKAESAVEKFMEKAKALDVEPEFYGKADHAAPEHHEIDGCTSYVSVCTTSSTSDLYLWKNGYSVRRRT
jgi:hypothetical protein